MLYDPLPEWEQVRKPKELPFWWDNMESVPIAKAAKKGPKEYREMPGMEAILHCLERHSRLSGTQLQIHIGHNYEVRGHNRFWRLAQPDEPQPVPFIHATEGTGTMQKRLLRHFGQHPDGWFSPNELRQALKNDRIEKLIKCLHNLYLAGKIERRLDLAPRRHPYQYRGLLQQTPVAGS